MPNCIICGEETRLIVLGGVICVKCDDALEERKIMNRQLNAMGMGRTNTPPIYSASA